MMRRFSSITLTAMVRCEVASGMERLSRHVLGDPAGGAAQGLQVLADRSGGAPRLAGAPAGLPGRCAIGLCEHVLPALVDRGAVVQVLLI